jgi:hypothetical protein
MTNRGPCPRTPRAEKPGRGVDASLLDPELLGQFQGSPANDHLAARRLMAVVEDPRSPDAEKVRATAAILTLGGANLKDADRAR